jgi:hypothetical protein
VPNTEGPTTNAATVKLAVMNGPDDGTEFALEQEQFVISASPEAHVQIHYDPAVPPGGVVVHIRSRDVVFEDPMTNHREQRLFGDLYTVGQTLIAIYRDEAESEQTSAEAAADVEGAGV